LDDSVLGGKKLDDFYWEKMFAETGHPASQLASSLDCRSIVF
jgi:hypothetical protein